MTRNVIEAVNNARGFFHIKDFPGNFFTLIEKENYTDKCGILLFKEDIEKLSGFIGYGEDCLTVICINYKRPIGHQNFTFAHELGHWFLHKGKNISDVDSYMYSKDLQEREANNFASELLYPDKLFMQDYSEILQKNLLHETKRKELAVYIDSLCHKYCLSFKMVLTKMLYKNGQGSKHKSINKQIVKSLGGNISEFFDKDFYVPNEDLPEYRQLKTPYNDLEKKINKLVSMGKIGEATAESIKLRNGIDIN